MKLPPLNAIRTFEAAARHLNYTKAAAELCVTPGAVSRAIANLEQYLKLPLFKQHRRQLQLTAAGQAYWFQVSQALTRLHMATTEVRQHHGEGGLLVIGVLHTLGERWMIPKLADFHKIFPNISIELKTLPSDFSKSFTELDLESHGVDVALYLSEQPWTGVICEPLFQERLIPVAAPQCKHLLQALDQGDPSCEEHLLLHTTRPHVWQTWFERYWTEKLQPRWPARFEHYFMVIEAALSGLGIALVPSILVETEIDKGNLLALQGKILTQELDYALMYHAVRERENKIRCFVDWLKTNTQSKKI